MDFQDDIFALDEGDRYFERRLKSNKCDKERIKDDLPLKLIERNNLNIRNVAEIGAYNGFRLAALSEKYNCRTVAFEPSKKAIDDGRKKYPKIEFFRNTAAKLNGSDDGFDLVIVDFVFHWIDRRMLFRSMAEIDRILVDDGWLVVGDFWVIHPQRRHYHHLPDKSVWTYKQNYWDIFLSSNCYRLIDSTSKLPTQNDSAPRFCALMQKTLNSGYAVEQDSSGINNLLKEIELVVFDFDGVFTDNKVIVNEDGKESVACDRSDGIGLSRLIDAGVEVLVLSAENNQVIYNRCKKLQISCIHGCKDKWRKLKTILLGKDINKENTAYVGNDINDVECLKNVGVPICVADAYPDVKKISTIITKRKGGKGAVREVCELIVKVRT